jgi:site-specific DNA-methyltransferase (adenine-specific)
MLAPILNVAQCRDALELLRSLPDTCAALAFFDPQHRAVLDHLQFGNEAARQCGRASLPAMTEDYIDATCREIARVLRPGGYLMLWVDTFGVCQAHHLRIADVVKAVDLIAWDSRHFGMGKRSRRRGDYLVVLQKPFLKKPFISPRTWRDHGIASRWIERVDRKRHPHIKPVRFIARLIGTVTQPGDLVIDPAAGSFAVLAAARVLGRDFIGCDLAYAGAQPIRSYFTEDKVTIRTELMNALDSTTSDGGEAFIVTDKIFARARTILHEHLSNKSLHEVDLLLADLKRDTREELHDLLRNTVDRDEAVDLIVRRYFGED